MFRTLQDYTRVNESRRPSASRYAELSLGKNTCGDPFNIEEQIDVEASYDMAPLANQLVVGGDSCNDGYYGLQALFDADIAILNGAGGHPLAAIASNSWGLFDEETAPPNVLKIEQSYLMRAAAEGVSMLFSAGDSSGIFTPADSPYATTVGGTTLGIGRKDPREFETGWSTGISLDFGTSWSFQGEQGATGGGPSLLWAQPAYQRGVVPRSLAASPGNRGGFVRTVPDISAIADPFTGFAVGQLVPNQKGVLTVTSNSPSAGPASPRRSSRAWWPPPSSISARSGSSTRRSTGWPGRAPTTTRCRSPRSRRQVTSGVATARPPSAAWRRSPRSTTRAPAWRVTPAR